MSKICQKIFKNDLLLWRHQSRGEGGFAKKWSYLISLFSKNDYEGGSGGQKSQKIDDVFYEQPKSKQGAERYLTISHETFGIAISKSSDFESKWNKFFSHF